MQCTQTSEIQDGGTKTGNTYVSTCIHGSCNISLATSIYSSSRYSAELFTILYHAHINHKFHNVQCERKSKIQEGGAKTGCLQKPDVYTNLEQLIHECNSQIWLGSGYCSSFNQKNIQIVRIC